MNKIETFGGQKEVINTFLLVLGYGVFLYLFQFFLSHIGFVSQVPNSSTLNHWDAGVYLNIAKNGYTYPDPRANNTGCFILFPWIWRILHVGVLGICIVNYLFFAVGFTILSRLYRISTVEAFLWLSVPAVYMMFIPYTEALFFLLMTVAFYGIIKKRRWLVWVSLFFASLTRATGIFLLPALLIMELLDHDKRAWLKAVYSYLIDYAFPLIAGLAFFVWYQHKAVGIWFAYFIQQRKYEGHELNIPVLPFSSMEGDRILWISALAVFCCFISVIVIAKKVYKWFFGNVEEHDKLFILSLVFLGATLFKTAFYNPTWGTGTTLTIGISRYVFATPFFYIFLYHFANRAVAYKPSQFVLAFILCNIVWLNCGAYIHIRYFIFFNFLTALVFLYMLLASRQFSWPPLAIVALNLLFQVIMFQQYLSGLYLE